MNKKLKRIFIILPAFVILAVVINVFIMAMPLTQGNNKLFVTLPAGNYLLRITEEPKLRSGVFEEISSDPRVSYQITNSEGQLVLAPTSADRSTFYVSKKFEYKQLLIEINSQAEQDSPLFFSFGGSK